MRNTIFNYFTEYCFHFDYISIMHFAVNLQKSSRSTLIMRFMTLGGPEADCVSPTCII